MRIRKKNKLRTTITINNEEMSTHVSKDSTPLKIADLLEPDFGVMVFGDGLRYVSEDMKVGIDVEALTKFAKVLNPMVKNDPRGGYYSQRDIIGAIEQAPHKT